MTEDLDKILSLYKKQLINDAEKKAIHEKNVVAYKNGTLMLPIVRWHLSVDEIDRQVGVNLVDSLLVDGLSIIEDVDIETLLNCMTESDQQMFRRRQLYEHAGDRSTSYIIHQWQQGKKLTPPTMIVITEQHLATVGDEHSLPSVELNPIDGKHRLNAAYYFGETTIPIIVRIPQLELIKGMLKMSA